MANSTYFIYLYPLCLTDRRLIFSSKQPTMLFRITRTTHQVFPGIMSMVQMSRRNRRQVCGTTMCRPRYIVVPFYIIRSIKILSIFRQMPLYGPSATRGGLITHEWSQLSQCLAQKGAMFLLHQLLHCLHR